MGYSSMTLSGMGIFSELARTVEVTAVGESKVEEVKGTGLELPTPHTSQ